MYYLIENNIILGCYSCKQSPEDILITTPRPSEFHQPTFDGEPSTETFTGWVLDSVSLLAAKKREYESAIETYINDIAGNLGYNTIYTAISYTNSNNPKWAAEAQALSDWRDAIWEQVFDIYKDVENGVIPIPELEDVIDDLPEYTYVYTE